MENTAEVQNVTQKAQEFQNTIAEISNQVKTLDVPDELFAAKSFMAIYEDPDQHLDAAIASMGRREASTHEKLIVGYAMQRLSVEHFVTFASAVFDSVDHNVTDVEVLESVVFAPLNYGKQNLIVHYQNSRVQGLLQRLLSAPKLSQNRKAYISGQMLTGKAKQDYLDYMDMLGRPVKE